MLLIAFYLIINHVVRPSDGPLILWNYWTDLNETLHVGWDWLSSGLESVSKVPPCPTGLLGP